MNYVMFPSTDNPAQRLYDLVHALHHHTDGRVLEIWAQVFNFEKDDIISFYRASGYMGELIEQVMYRIDQIPDEDHEFFLEWVPDVERALSPAGINERWAQYRQYISTGQLVGIKHCARLLGKHHVEVALKMDELDRLKDQVAKLMREVRDSDIDVELKLLLHDLLASINFALMNYRFRGMDGVKKAIIQAYGLVQLNKEKFDKAKSNEVVKDVGIFLGAVVTAITAAYKIKELGNDLSDALVAPLLGG